MADQRGPKDQLPELVREVDRLRRRIVELEQGGEAATQSERSFREVSDALPVVVFTSTADGLVDFVNRAFTELTGVTTARLHSEGTAAWLSAVHPDDVPAVVEAWPRVMREGTEYAFEFRLRSAAAGSYRWHLVRATPMRDERGLLARWYGTAVDVHETRIAEEREREKAALLDRTQDAIFLQDAEGRLRYVNRAAEKLFGWVRDDVLGRRLDDLALGESDAVRAAARQAWDHGTWRGDLVPFVDGRVLEGRWSRLRSSDGLAEGVLAFHTDVTESRRLEQVMLRAQRMESIGTLAGGLAHDLNNVLTPIVFSVDLLRASMTHSTVDLETIAECATRGTEMVGQLLAFARGYEAPSSAIDVEVVIGEVVRLVRDSFPKSIAWDLDLSRGGHVRGDAAQLRQLLLNLFVNARDAMPEGGTLGVRIERMDVVAPDAEASTAGEHVVIAIEDTGVGMSPELLTRVFEPFFTTKGKGTGLGLATVHSVAKAHRGFVRVESELGRGTRFRICLPASDEATRSEATSTVTSSMTRGNGEGVLFVDDDATIRSVVSRALERFGYRVWTAEHGVAALSVFDAHRLEIHVVVTDGAMPVMDGAGLVRVLHERAPELPIVTASGHDAKEQLAFVGVDTQHVIAKPYSVEALLMTLRRVLAR